MLSSMTGFASREVEVAPMGKISMEIRSTNHKFFEAVFHLPEGFLPLEDKIKKEIESKIKRGRITCIVTLNTKKSSGIFINKPLLKRYLSTIEEIKRGFHVKGEISIDTLVTLPGILSIQEDGLPKENIWPRLKVLAEQAVNDLVKVRQKEGRALRGYLKAKAEAAKSNLRFIRDRFKRAIKEKTLQMNTDEERASFIKNTDVTEEIERLAFHIKNFNAKIQKAGPIGKELDFIAQEMQREANTLAAKTFDVAISSRIVQIKSQIEKIREQVQNIE